jgi:hypothetical protein
LGVATGRFGVKNLNIAAKLKAVATVIGYYRKALKNRKMLNTTYIIHVAIK